MRYILVTLGAAFLLETFWPQMASRYYVHHLYCTGSFLLAASRMVRSTLRGWARESAFQDSLLILFVLIMMSFSCYVTISLIPFFAALMCIGVLLASED